MRLNINEFSDKYSIRILCEKDADTVLHLCQGNPQYYEYSKKKLSAENILKDIRNVPPGVSPEDRYYVGYFDGEKLEAVLDLVDGCPGSKFAYIGFFMLDKTLQGCGTGSMIVKDLLAYLKKAGFVICRLGIDRDNPQSNHFWMKNGFRGVNIVEDILVADINLQL